MIVVEIVDHYGPFGGHGGYGTERRTGVHTRSIKRAVELAKRAPRIGSIGGGVPILGEFRITVDGKVIHSVID